jgi:ribosome biogenesis GTPase
MEQRHNLKSGGSTGSNNGESNLPTARIVAEHRDRYVIQDNSGTYFAEITGNLRFTAQSREAFPAVGDLVEIMMMDKSNAVITGILPRSTILRRQAVGKYAETQVMAANIDFALIVLSVGQDFNLNRIDRYLMICHASGILPVIVLSKTDLVTEETRRKLVEEIRERIGKIDILTASCVTPEGLDPLRNFLQPSKIYCFLGSSGAGKSTLLNHLSGKELMKTSEISISTNKGRHTTSHRELFFLPNGSMVIDTPGMREVGLVDSEEGIIETFNQISELSSHCRFRDCTHTSEAGCAVLEALDRGELSADLYESYLKLKREQAHFSASLKEKRQKSKEQGKLFKAIKKEVKKKKF